MPRIPDQMIHAAVYLYPSIEAAKAGHDSGGTGFVLIHPHKNNPARGSLCIVTNKHVIQRAPVPRLNRKDGGRPDCLPIEPHDWFPHRGPHDVAILVGVLNQDIHKYTQTPTSQLVSREMAAEYKIGVGDDVYMIGRFIGHDGVVHNEPTARFGNISAAARKMKNYEAGYDEESFAVEMKSKPGYSGSPTFVYSSVFNQVFSKVRDSDHSAFHLLLGINWGHIHEKRPLLDEYGKQVPGRFVTEASGMNGVVPAWHILELLQQDEVAKALSEVEANDAVYQLKKLALAASNATAPG